MPAAASRPTVVRAGSIASTGRIKLIARRQLQNQQINFNTTTRVQTPGNDPDNPPPEGTNAIAKARTSQARRPYRPGRRTSIIIVVVV